MDVFYTSYQRNGLYPIHYHNQLWLDHEKGYHSTEKELLAIVKSIKKFRGHHLTQGKTFIIFSDCTYVKSAFRKMNPDKNTRHNRWFNLLNGMKWCIIHKPAPENGLADFLSRYSYQENKQNSVIKFENYTRDQLIELLKRNQRNKYQKMNLFQRN